MKSNTSVRCSKMNGTPSKAAALAESCRKIEVDGIKDIKAAGFALSKRVRLVETNRPEDWLQYTDCPFPCSPCCMEGRQFR